MDIEFVKTDDGWLNPHFIVLVHRHEVGDFHGDWEIEYVLGGMARSTKASDSQVQNLLGLGLKV